MQSYEVSADPARLDIVAIHAFLSQTYWSRGIPLSTVESAIRNSISVGLYCDGQQVGLVRMITDKATYAYLADVYVLEAHRGRGLSKRMLETLLALPDLQGLRRMMLATRDAHGLYEKFGFKALASPEHFMDLHDQEIYSRTARQEG